MAEKSVEKREIDTTQERPVIYATSCICEEDDKIVLELDMPGVSKDGVDIDVDNNTLTIYGKRDLASEEGAYLLRERRFGDFRRVFTIDDTVDKEKIEASMDKGVLTVHLHLKEPEKPKKISVKNG
jgi:HSP20 family protein